MEKERLKSHAIAMMMIALIIVAFHGPALAQTKLWPCQIRHREQMNRQERENDFVAPLDNMRNTVDLAHALISDVFEHDSELWGALRGEFSKRLFDTKAIWLYKMPKCEEFIELYLAFADWSARVQVQLYTGAVMLSDDHSNGLLKAFDAVDMLRK